MRPDEEQQKVVVLGQDRLIRALLEVSDNDEYLQRFYPKLVVDLGECQTAEEVAIAFVGASKAYLQATGFRKSAASALDALMPQFIKAVLPGQPEAVAAIIALYQGEADEVEFEEDEDDD